MSPSHTPSFRKLLHPRRRAPSRASPRNARAVGVGAARFSTTRQSSGERSSDWLSETFPKESPSIARLSRAPAARTRGALLTEGASPRRTVGARRTVLGRRVKDARRAAPRRARAPKGDLVRHRRMEVADKRAKHTHGCPSSRWSRRRLSRLRTSRRTLRKILQTFADVSRDGTNSFSSPPPPPKTLRRTLRPSRVPGLKARRVQHRDAAKTRGSLNHRRPRARRRRRREPRRAPRRPPDAATNPRCGGDAARRARTGASDDATQRRTNLSSLPKSNSRCRWSLARF